MKWLLESALRPVVLHVVSLIVVALVLVLGTLGLIDVELLHELLHKFYD